MSHWPRNIQQSHPARWWRLSSAAGWVAATLLVVLLWGLVDPFKICRNFDWIIQDKFLQYRPPPPIHDDLLQVSIDDFAAERLSKNALRRQMARAIRQLKQLGAKTVLVDVLLFGRGSRDSVNRDDLVDYEGIPVDIAQHITDLPNRFLEDQMLSVSLADFDRVIIPFHLRDTTGLEDEASRSTLNAMVDRLKQNNLLDIREFASQLNIKDLNAATRLYEQASEIVAERIAREPELEQMAHVLERSMRVRETAWTAELLAEKLGIELQTATDLFDSAYALALDRSLRDPNHVKQGIGIVPSAIALRVPIAVDRLSVLDRVRTVGTFPLPVQSSVERVDDLEVPLSDFATDAVLGFADFGPDSDGTFRRMALLARWGDCGVAHQSLAVLAVHLGVKLSDLRLESGTIRIDSRHVVPIDASGQLPINWPTNGEEGSFEKLSQLSLGDLLELAKYDSDLMKNRHNLRLNVAFLDNELNLGFSDDDKCDILLNAIYDDYIAGRFGAAHEKEQLFDNDYLPKALNHEKALAILLRVKHTPLKGADAENQALVSAQSIVAIQQEIGKIAQARDDQIRRLRKKVTGKLCLIGDTTTAGEDLKRTPVGPRVPGVTINLAAINTMLTGRYLTVPRRWMSALLTLMLGVVFSWVFVRFHALVAFTAAIVGLPLIAWGHYQALVRADVLISPVLPMIGVSVCYLTTATRRWWLDAQEKRKIRHAFQHYLHPVIVDKVSRNPELLRLGGEDAELSILFADIRGFSAVSEDLTAEQLQKLLNGFLTPMTEIIFDHNGTLDKYIGDEMMAFFGAPLPNDNHAFQACQAALAMIRRLSELQQVWRDQGLPAVRIGIGINTDVVRVGNFGSDMRFDYTVIGDGVNLASRLEGATKQYGVDVLISESTYKHLNGRIVTRELDRIRVVGKQEPTRIFEVVGLPPLDDDLQSFLDRFRAGIDAYRSRQWTTAIDHFQQALEIVPDDAPAKIHIERCQAFIANPPSSDWDTVYVMLTK